MRRQHRSLAWILSAALLSAACVLSSCASSTAATDSLSAEERRSRKAAESFAARQKTDPYTGWTYVPQSKVDVSNGIVRLVLDGKKGTFCIYARQEDGQDVPVLATADSFASTFFGVRIGRQSYRLNSEDGVRSEARITPYGAQMAYTVPSKAYVVVDFGFMPSVPGSALVDMLRVSVYCINIGKTVQTFAVKAVFDTCLGETTRAHFSTAALSLVNTESIFSSMDTDLWVRSRNADAAVQFLLHGSGITGTETVMLANKDTLSQQAWVPSVQEDRSFSSVLSYENSAVGVHWPAVYLDPMRSDIITFYLSLSADGSAPAGKEFLRSLASGSTSLAPAEDGGNEADDPADGVPWLSPQDDGGLSFPADDAYVPPVQVPSRVTYGLGGELDGEYIQSLIDRIDELSENPTLADDAEIESLHQELDQILDKLRSLR